MNSAGCTSSFPVVLPDLISGIFPFSGKNRGGHGAGLYRKRAGLSGHFIETTDRQAADGGFIGNTLIEFVKGWSPKKAEEYAAIRQSRLDELENRRALEAAKRLEERKSRRNGPNRKKKKEKPPCSAGGHYAGASVEPGACRAVKAIPLRRYCENKAPACNRLCGRRISA